MLTEVAAAFAMSLMVHASNAGADAWPELLPIVVRNLNTGAEAQILLYGSDGALDDDALDAFARVVARDDGDEPVSLTPRLVQLAIKAAYHFHASSLVSLSAFRAQIPFKGSRHATGEAIDFKLEGVKAPVLAAYLRGFALVGVGVYTHPRTQYVHLDVREESYHWIDGSPPGVTWREAPLRDPFRAMRDAAYSPELDLPLGK
jgi:uncharacterized protein YcbK (DUF882 family)